MILMQPKSASPKNDIICGYPVIPHEQYLSIFREFSNEILISISNNIQNSLSIDNRIESIQENDKLNNIRSYLFQK